jgi:hypothetical protein
LVDIFYPFAGTIFSKEGGVNGHPWYNIDTRNVIDKTQSLRWMTLVEE